MTKEMFVRVLRDNKFKFSQKVHTDYGVMDSYMSKPEVGLQVMVNDSKRVKMYYRGRETYNQLGYEKALRILDASGFDTKTVKEEELFEQEQRLDISHKDRYYQNNTYTSMNPKIKDTMLKAPYKVTILMHMPTDEGAGIIVKGKHYNTTLPKFSFEVSEKLTREQVMQLVKIPYPVKKISANYEFPEESRNIFEGIDNKFVPFIEVDIRPGRAVGNTYRCVDRAVDILFTHGSVYLKDHYEEGAKGEANYDFKRKLLTRLSVEHKIYIKGEYAPATGHRYVSLDTLNVKSANWLILEK